MARRAVMNTMSPKPATVAIVLALIVSAPSAAQPRQAPAELKQYEGRYYVMHTDLDPASAREAEIRMTKMAEEYHQRTKDFAGEIRAKFPFYLFRHERDYQLAGGRPGSAGGFNPNSDTLMAVAGERLDLRTWHTIQHEGFHQFADAVIGGELPIWANEGLAEYFGEAIFTGDAFVAGVIPQWRLARVRDTIAAKKFTPMREMMLMSHERWNQGLSVTNYDQAWTMVHFLVHADNGAYRRAFAGFIRDVGNKQPWEKAWLNNLGPADGFEAKWRGYWTKLADDPTIDLYAEATVRTFTSFFARAVASKQKFGDFETFLAAAEKGELKSSDADWLPRSLLDDTVKLSETLREAGGEYSLISTSTRPPQVVYQEKGVKIVGRFTLKDGRVEKVTIDRTKR